MAKVEAAGITFYCRSTNNYLLLYRSANVVDGSCWCGAGGKIEDGETPEQAARREIAEEIGFDTYGEGQYVSLYRYEDANLIFYNFLGIVEEQFFPVLNWESDGYVWIKEKDFPTGDAMHFGMKAILADKSAKKIMDALCVPNGKMPEGDLQAACVKFNRSLVRASIPGASMWNHK